MTDDFTEMAELESPPANKKKKKAKLETDLQLLLNFDVKDKLFEFDPSRPPRNIDVSQFILSRTKLLK